MLFYPLFLIHFLKVTIKKIKNTNTSSIKIPILSKRSKNRHEEDYYSCMARYNPAIDSRRPKARRMPISHSNRERVDRSRKRKCNQIQLLVGQRRWNGKRGSVPENSETHAAQVGLIYFTWWDISSRGGGFYIPVYGVFMCRRLS